MKYTRFDALQFRLQECGRAGYLDSNDDGSSPVSEKHCFRSWALCHRYRMLMPQRYSFEFRLVPMGTGRKGSVKAGRDANLSLREQLSCAGGQV